MINLPSTIFAQDSVCIITPDILDELKKLAEQAPLKRSRFCLHLSTKDAVQEMVVVLVKDTYIRPHRHPGKTESFHMIEGAVIVALFDDAGAVQQTIYLSAEKGNPFMYRLSSPLWHTVVPLTECTVFHEAIMGPFAPSEYPSWEPFQDDPESTTAFREKIMDHAYNENRFFMEQAPNFGKAMQPL